MPIPGDSAGLPVLLAPADLTPFQADIPLAKAEAMIADAVAMAAQVAPCITAADFAYPDAVKAILRGAVLRWNDAGTGAAQTQSTGPFSVSYDNRQPRRGMFWPSEIQQLQDLCRTTSTGAFSIMPGPVVSTGHADICALNFGAEYCSCGAVLTNLLYPLYETG